MGTQNSSAISRREFAKRAAMVSAAASLSPAELLQEHAPPAAPPASQSPTVPDLSPEGQTEAQSRIDSILAQYGSRLSDAQKADLTRLSNAAQPMLERLRDYPIDNADGPGLYLKPLLEHEKKPGAAPATSKPAAAPKKS